MSGWDRDSVARSVRRYLSLTLGDPWTLRLERREIPEEDRPVAVLDLGPETVLRARESLEQGEVQTLYPVTISAYPAVGEDERASAHDARLLAAQLQAWITTGLTVRDGDDRDWAGPFRIPLWDYTGLPVSGPSRAGPDDPHDVLYVLRESLSVRPIVDPDDARRYGVFCEFRLTVEAPGRVSDPDAPLVTEMPGEWAGPPPGP